MEGKGVYTFASGVKYDGQLKNGMFHGQGTLHFPNGYQYNFLFIDYSLYKNPYLTILPIYAYTCLYIYTYICICIYN